MKGIAAFITISCLSLFLLVGCSKSANPVSLDEEELYRGIQAFGTGIPIFGTNPADPSEPPHYHNIDLAWTRTAFCPTCGDAITDYCSAVTLEREDNTPDHPFKPWFRWLDSSTPGPGWGPSPVAERDALNPNHQADYRNPKCAALVYQDAPEDCFIELAVCYQVRNSGEDDNDDWDIGVTRLQWYDDGQQYYSQFPDLGPARRIDEDILNDPSGDNQWDEMNPDIAYDYTNGDIYLVYENSEAGCRAQAKGVFDRVCARIHNFFSHVAQHPVLNFATIVILSLRDAGNDPPPRHFSHSLSL